jgi:phosphate-selective porin
MRGKTGMGAAPIFVDADVAAWYVLVSHKMGRERFSARYDGFSTTDRDHSPAETNTEHGRSWLFAWLHDVSDHVRIGAEFVQVTGDRIAAQESGFGPNTDGHTVTVELRYSF